MLADGWVADVKSESSGDDEEAITGTMEEFLRRDFGVPDEGPELLRGASVTEDDKAAGPWSSVDDGT